MAQSSFITTSWDDGHPADCRVADLLAKYDLRGTFYVPRHGPSQTMDAEQIRHLTGQFEIGAHTINHCVLIHVDDAQAKREIVESKAWIEQITGQPCPMFCPPQGKFSARHLQFIAEAGYIGVRTVELLSVDYPRRTEALRIMPTTLQLYGHGPGAYLKNVIKRTSVRNLLHYLRYGRARDLESMTLALVQLARRRGGVFHLWGHSWELEQMNLWNQLESLLKLLSQFTATSPAATNGSICLRAHVDFSIQLDETSLTK